MILVLLAFAGLAVALGWRNRPLTGSFDVPDRDAERVRADVAALERQRPSRSRISFAAGTRSPA